MTRYRECDLCGFKAKLPDGVDGSDFLGWGVHKGSDLCPTCSPKYIELLEELEKKKNEALNKFLKL